MELVSVLMPCRNAAPWIGQALRSALQQTWPCLEVIVVDDGSTDGSAQVARQFASARCRVIQQGPRGASAARNHALSLAQGSLIQYLDADDLLSPEKVARQVAAMRDHGPQALSWSSATYLLDGRVDGRSRYQPAQPARGSAEDFLAHLWGGGEKPPGMVLVHQWLASRQLLLEAGPWNEELSVDDDGEFFARVILAAGSRIAVPGACCSYRKFHHRQNLSASGCHSSALQAACLKAGHLLNKVNNASARRAVTRLLTQALIDTYPDPTYRRGLQFLREHGLPMTSELAAPLWFQRAKPIIGWKAARRLQNLARAWRAPGSVAGSRPT